LERRYVKPPIVEAACEFVLPPDSKWDLTIPGMIYEKVRGTFPNREQQVVPKLEVMQQTSREIKQRLGTEERVFLYDAEKKTSLQLGPRLLSVSRRKPYISWDSFRPLIELASKALLETVEFKNFAKVSLSYSNLIEIPGSSAQLENFFEFRPYLGAGLPQNVVNFIVGAELPRADLRDICRITLTTARPAKPDNMCFLLTLEYYLLRPKAVDTAGVMEWVDAAHADIQGAFEAILTPRLRELFGEVS
jgi:uncharacterized protein (TIGR04255 family)